MTPSKTLDNTIRSLERDALTGDHDAVRRLAALASRTAEAPPVEEGIKLSPRETGCSARAVRNWFIDLDVDGRESSVQTGPKAKGGGFWFRLLQRKEGGAVEALSLRGVAQGDQLLLYLNDREVYRSER
jgi:hypothetical protein